MKNFVTILSNAGLGMAMFGLVLEEFFHLRLEFYVKRKKVMLDNLEIKLLRLSNKVRFIIGVVEGEIIVSNRKRADLVLELQ
ncbi:DNA topoisomerase 2-like isoform X2 [Magnolia sinica]|uniref:DNA topoisomerase 2-like isoform X2 n=1 Tax=Magnolia sinica TaxID=86752 RepID=UPI002659A5AC|nr:DNA topoisomerase 2-like isoform X2 [Magnolia sinica]